MFSNLFGDKPSQHVMQNQADAALNLTIELCINSYGEDHPNLIELIEMHFQTLSDGYKAAELLKKSILPKRFEIRQISTPEVFKFGGHVEWNHNGNLVFRINNHLGEDKNLLNSDKARLKSIPRINEELTKHIQGSSSISFSKNFKKCEICNDSETGQLIELHYVCSNCRQLYL